MRAVVTLTLAALALGGLMATPALAAPTWVTANSNSTGDQDTAAVATNRNGDVAVVWEDDRDTTEPENNNHSEIYLRLFRNGTAAYELKLSAGGTSGVQWKHIAPDVGLDDQGNAVVVWADDPDGNGFYNIPYRVVSPAGAVRASGRANASTDGQQLWPKVAVDPDGTAATPAAVAFTVAWEDTQGSAPSTVRAAGFTNLTTKAYEVAASHPTGSHRRPDVAVSASGDARVVWEEDSDANAAYNIGLVGLAKANGAVNLTRRLANATAGGQHARPSVASNFNGDFAVAWESGGSAWTRSFTPAGAPRHGDVSVASGARVPGIGIDDQANTVVAWTVQATDLDTWARGFNPDGTPTGRLAAQALMSVPGGKQDGMAVAVSAFGEVSVTYADDNDGNTWDQVYLGMGFVNSSW